MSKFSRIIGIVGIVALLSVPLTMFLWDWEFTWLVATKLLFGVFAIVFWLFSNASSLRATFQGRATFYLAFTILFVVLGFGTAAIVNYIFYKYPMRFDLTKEKIHSLSDQSTQLLAKLDGKVEAIALYNAKEPLYEVVHQYLERYRYASNNFTYEFVDPVVRQDLVEQYGLQTGGPRLILTLTNASEPVKEERVKLDEERNPEEAITTALLKLTSTDTKPKICFSTGHGEKVLESENTDGAQPDRASDEQLNSLSLFAKDLTIEGYQTDTLLLAEKKAIPADCGIVVMVGPRGTISPDEIDILKKYLDANGNLLVFVGSQDTNSLSPLLKGYGIEVGNNTVVSPERRSPLEVVTNPALYPSNHPIFSRLAEGYSAVFPVARSVRTATPPAKLEVTSLASSSKYSWAEVDNLTGATKVTFDEGKDLPGPVSLAVAVTGKGSSPNPSDTAAGENLKTMRMVVFGSSHLVADAYYLVYQFNRNLVMNTIAWFANEGAGITIRPNFRAATILRLNESQMKFVTFFSIDILPLLILAFGIAVWQTRRWS
jgi:ABC-2 type transport system permease protein